MVEEVSNIIKESIEGSIGGNAYQHNKVNQWTSSVVEQCLNQLTKLSKPFKYIGKFSLLSQRFISYLHVAPLTPHRKYGESCHQDGCYRSWWIATVAPNRDKLWRLRRIVTDCGSCDGLRRMGRTDCDGLLQIVTDCNGLRQIVMDCNGL